jgi:hypothetical protein
MVSTRETDFVQSRPLRQSHNFQSTFDSEDILDREKVQRTIDGEKELKNSLNLANSPTRNLNYTMNRRYNGSGAMTIMPLHKHELNNEFTAEHQYQEKKSQKFGEVLGLANNPGYHRH